MSFAFRSKLIEGRSGYFSDSLSIGVKEPAGGLFNLSGGDFIHKSGVAYFDSRPRVGGIPVLLSGEADSEPGSGYAGTGDLYALSGYFDSEISNATSSSGVLSNLYLESLLNSSSETYFQENSYDGFGFLTGVAVWDAPSKNTKLFKKQLNYSGEYLTGVILSDEISQKTLTKTLSYDGNDNLISTTRIYT